MVAENRIMLYGSMIERDALRHTPAGVPILRFRLAHHSEQREGGTLRQVDCEIAAVAVEREASLLAVAPLGTRLTVAGFIDSRGRSGRQLVLHATGIEFETND